MSNLHNRISNNIKRYGLKGFIKSSADVALRNAIPTAQLVEAGTSSTEGIVYRADLPSHEDVNEIYYFSEKDDICINEPTTVESGLNLFSEYCGYYNLSRPFVCDLSDISLIGSKAIGVDSNNKIILETVMSRRDLVDKYFQMKPTDIYYFKKKSDLKRNQHDYSVACLVEYHGGFHHWMYNSLPRLQGIKEYEKKTGKDCQIIIPPNPPSYMLESLKLFGYDSEDLIEWDQNITHPTSLIVPTIRRIENKNVSSEDVSRKIPSPSAGKWLRRTALNKIDQDVGDYPKNIIISRGDVPTRQIINKKELYSSLRKKDFVPFKLANLSFQEQVAVFASAENIISPHGAGLSNLYFSKNVNVIEIFGTNVKKPTYYFLAEVLDHNYGAIVGHQDRKGDKNSDISVDVAQLHQIMSKMNI